MTRRLTLFDLDHTLLAGDSDVLWCDFLCAKGLLAESFREANARMERDYRAGNVGAQAYCEFYVSTLAGRTQHEWLPLRAEFVERVVEPRIPAAAHALVAQHRNAGDQLVLTTATNRFISELTASHLGIANLIATECELGDDGRFTGRTSGTLNMREGKVQRLSDWMATQALQLADVESTLYSDSINDLPLLAVVQRAVVVDPDATLAAEARARGWMMISLHAGAAA
jgi:HAD superfamily hydrolase (TIGR01490 family)